MKLSLLTFALSAGFSALTSCAVAAPIDDAKTLLAKGNAQAAVDTLQPSLDQNLSNADFNYVLGIALLDSGKAGEALFAFERVLAIEPGNVLARAELARAMIALSELEAARIELQRTRGGRLPADVTSKIDLLLSELDGAILAKAQHNGAPVFSAYAEGEVGYDSNINTATNNNSVLIPLFGVAAALTGFSRAQPSTLIGLNAGFTAQKRVSDGVDIYGSVDGRFRYYTDKQDYAPVALFAGAGVRVTRGADQFSVGLSQFTYYIGATHNDDQLSLYGQWQRQLNRQNVAGFFVTYAQAKHPVIPALNTNISMLGGTWTHAYLAKGDPRLTVTAWAADDKELSNDPTVGRTFYGLKVSGEYQLQENWKLFGGLTMQASRYGGQSAFFLVKREDSRYDVNVGASYKNDKLWTYTGQLTSTRNNSNIVINDFARDQLIFTARREF